MTTTKQLEEDLSVHDLVAHAQVLLKLLRRRHRAARLEEDLDAVRQDALGLLDGRRLLARRLLAHGPVRGLLLAALVQLRQVLLVLGERLLRRGELLLGAVELLLRARALLRRLAELLLHHRRLVLEALLDHLVRVRGLGLLLARVRERLLGLLLHVGDRVENSARFRLVGRGRRLRLEGEVLVLVLRLEERLEDGLLVRRDPRGLNDLLEAAREEAEVLGDAAAL